MRRGQLGLGGAVATKRGFVTMPPLDEPVRQKLGLHDALAILDKQATKQRTTMTELFKGPVTLRTMARAFTSENDAAGVMHTINQRFRPAYGKDAILREYLSEGKGHNNFWVIRLNPEIFDVPSTYKLVVGTDIRLSDVLTPARKGAVLAIAAHNFCTRSQIRAMENARVVLHVLIDSRFPKYIEAIQTKVDKKIPYPICRTASMPLLYYVDKTFARAFGIRLSRVRPTYEEAFLEEDKQILDELRAAGELNTRQLVAILGIDRNRITGRIRRIKSRCKELGFPQPIKKERAESGKNRYKFNEKFSEHMPAKKKEPRKIESVFTETQKQIILFIAGHPFSRTRDIAKGLGIKQASVEPVIRRIKAIIAGLEEETKEAFLLDPKKHGKRYAFAKAFYEFFGMAYVLPDPTAVLAPQQQKIYHALVKRGDKKNKEVAQELGITEGNLSCTRDRINRALVANGFRPIPSKSNKKDAMRAEGGKPQMDLSKFDSPNAAFDRMDRRGVRSQKKLPLRIGSREVAKACAAALERGANIEDIKRIVEGTEEGQKALEKINALEMGRPAFRKKR